MSDSRAAGISGPDRIPQPYRAGRSFLSNPKVQAVAAAVGVVAMVGLALFVHFYLQVPTSSEYFYVPLIAAGLALIYLCIKANKIYQKAMRNQHLAEWVYSINLQSLPPKTSDAIDHDLMRSDVWDGNMIISSPSTDQEEDRAHVSRIRGYIKEHFPEIDDSRLQLLTQALITPDLFAQVTQEVQRAFPGANVTGNMHEFRMSRHRDSVFVEGTAKFQAKREESALAHYRAKVYINVASGNGVARLYKVN